MAYKLAKINQALRRILAELIARELEFPPNSLVALTRVEMSKDLRSVTVFFSCYPDGLEERALKIFNLKKPLLRGLLSRQMRFKKVPEIFFQLESEEPIS